MKIPPPRIHLHPISPVAPHIIITFIGHIIVNAELRLSNYQLLLRVGEDDSLMVLGGVCLGFVKLADHDVVTKLKW